MDAFDFVADTGASGLVPEVVGGKLRRANEHKVTSETPSGVGAWERGHERDYRD
jgi:hypothetical protein